MSPPLRTDADREALWKGPLENGEIQIVATDHCPFNYGIEKQMGKDDFTKCPNGAPGVEERMILLFSEGVMKNRISLNRFVEVACTNPAKVYGLYPKKGILNRGADADLIILDPEREQTLTHANMHGAVDYTAYEGVPVKGYIDLVMQRGNVIAKENRFTGARGAGEFIHRKTDLERRVFFPCPDKKYRILRNTEYKGAGNEKAGERKRRSTVGSEVAGHIKISSDGSCWVFCCALRLYRLSFLPRNEQPAGSVKMVVLLPGEIDDQSWNTGNYKGIMACRKALDVELRYEKNVSEADSEAMPGGMPTKGYQFILAAGTQFEEPVSRWQTSIPKLIFVSSTDGKAVDECVWRISERR